MNAPISGVSIETPRSNIASERIVQDRSRTQANPENIDSASSEKQVQSEELINQIKALTEDGLYSVRFESNDQNDLIVKVVDRDTNEVIRQIPPKELIELTKHLKELQGNIVDVVG